MIMFSHICDWDYTKIHVNASALTLLCYQFLLFSPPPPHLPPLFLPLFIFWKNKFYQKPFEYAIDLVGC